MPESVTDAVAKAAVAEFWEQAACGEIYAQPGAVKDFYESQARTRYALEPYIVDFADFKSGRGRDVLEIGVGMGADHVEWAKAAPQTLTGVDLTERAIAFTHERLALSQMTSRLEVADAERLPFPNSS